MLVLAAVVWAVVAALVARQRLNHVRDDLTALIANNSASADEIRHHLRVDLATAQAARDVLDQPGPRLLSDVPLLGRSWVAERTVADAGVSVIDAYRVLLADAADLNHGGQIDLTQLGRVQHDVVAAQQQVGPPLHRLAALHTRGAPGFVGNAVTAARNRLLPVASELARARAAIGAFSDIFGAHGPRTILIGLENNAELRGGGGLISSYGLAKAVDGRLVVGAFHDVDSVTDTSHNERRVPAPPDYLKTYGPYLANSTLWKNVNMSPSTPDGAQVLANIAAASLGVRPDVVALFDVPATARLITATGQSVQLPNGNEASGKELVRDLLVETYGSGSLDQFTQQRRREAIERSADAALRNGLSQSSSPGILRALATAAAGRHIAVWSSQPGVEADLVAAGAAGSITAPGSTPVVISADNLGDSAGNGNKLDYYVRRDVRIDAAVGRTSATVLETVTVHNNAPAGLGPYVEGVRHPGRLAELWSFVMPADAHLVTFQIGNEQEISPQVDPINGAKQLLSTVTTPRGTATTMRLEYTVPVHDKTFRLTAIPQPLASPANLTLRLGAAAHTTLRNKGVRWSGSWTVPKTATVSVN